MTDIGHLKTIWWFHVVSVDGDTQKIDGLDMFRMEHPIRMDDGGGQPYLWNPPYETMR